MNWTLRLRFGRHETRRLVLLFILVTFVPAVLLVGFGWRALRDDRERALDQIQLQRERATDAVVSLLDQQLESVERSLAESSAFPKVGVNDDALVLRLSAGKVESSPEGRLAFLPVAPALREAPPQALEVAEKAEYRDRDHARAIEAFRSLTTVDDAAIRAPALIGLARNLHKLGRDDEALAAYERASRLSGVAVVDVPADLFALSARCDLLMSIGREVQARAEARQLLTDLRRGRWALTKTIYGAREIDAQGWLDEAAHDTSALAWSEAADWTWTTWQLVREARPSSGRESISTQGSQKTIVWASRSDRMDAFVIGSDYIRKHWIAALTPMLQAQRLSVDLDLPTVASDSPVDATRRTARESGLPWTITVTSSDVQTDLARASSHQALWMASLIIVGVLVAGGGFVVARAVSRDMAVAKLQSDFVAAVSHEFRTPLTSLKQVSEALIDGRVPAGEDPRDYYRTLGRQTERLHRLVETLLDFGRMEAGKSAYRLTPTDLHELVQDVIREFQEEVRERGYEIALQPGGDTAVVAADRDALHSAVWNLLDNAVKYSPECKAVEVTLVREASHVAIRVRDRGLGIPLAEQGVIFSKFVRGASAADGRIRGTGVGLALVSHVVLGHGGDVRVDSTPGLGSTFSIVLPIVEATWPRS